MEAPLTVSLLNDFIFCPASIYFHMVDAEAEKITYASTEQMQGSAMHEAVDNANYSDKSSVLQGITVYSERYNLIGKIDLFDTEKGVLTERKRKISQLFDGQIFQVYAYCYALREMGYNVRAIRIHSEIDNKTYPIPLPEDDTDMLNKFENVVTKMSSFRLSQFKQDNIKKCEKCVYEPLCAYSQMN